MKPRLTLSMMQLDPLPKRATLARKIKESYEFIDANPNITLAELPKKYIKLWRVEDLSLIEDIDRYPITNDRFCHPSVLTSLVVFAYIYSRYYKEEDYADFQNFWDTYLGFQNMIGLTSATASKLLIEIKVFDLTHFPVY